MALHIKIEGLTNAADARRVIDLGADAVGLVFAPSPRQVTVEQARAVVEAIPEQLRTSIWTIGVFVNASVDQINQVVSQTNITHVQLHGDEPPEFVEQVNARCIKAFRIRSAAWADEVQQWLSGLANVNHLAAVVLDAYDRSARGGTGKRFNWNWVADDAAMALRENCPPVILAGGLSPDCVADAVRTVRPWGLDVASGVEASPGVKDFDKIKAFIDSARAALPDVGDTGVCRWLARGPRGRLLAYLERNPFAKRQRMGSDWPVLFQALALPARKRHALLRTLFRAGVSPDQRDASEMTALMLAASSGYVEAMAILLAAGADPNARNTSGETALGYACCADNFAGAKLLYEHKAEINVLDNAGWSEELDSAKYYASKRFYNYLVSIGCRHAATAPGHEPYE